MHVHVVSILVSIDFMKAFRKLLRHTIIFSDRLDKVKIGMQKETLTRKLLK